MAPEVSVQRQTIDVDYLSMLASSSTLKAGIWHLHVVPMLEINESSVQPTPKNESLLGFYGDGRYIVISEHNSNNNNNNNNNNLLYPIKARINVIKMALHSSIENI